MIQVSNVKMPLDWGVERSTEALVRATSEKLGIDSARIASYELVRQGIDARKKSEIRFVVTSIVGLDSEELEADLVSKFGDVRFYEHKERPVPVYSGPRSFTGTRPIVVGSGPAGLFCALTLARSGIPPVIVERGSSVDKRHESIETFSSTGILDSRTNVQFGEGGAGLHSDGKLTTGISDPFLRYVLESFVEHGAPSSVLWEAKPHVGTDVLPSVVKKIREDIESCGGTFEFETKFVGYEQKDGKVVAAEFEKADGTRYKVDADCVVLATGHSARDTYEMLYESGMSLKAKPLSIGFRIEHLRENVDRSQYGSFAGHPALGAADYKLSCHLKTGRSVYTFCMCPGGEVVAAASEEGRVCVNGMSRLARDGVNSNSAVLVDLSPKDFGDSSPIAGIEFQRKWERLAFEAGGGDYRAPVQLVGDFMQGIESTCLGEVEPSYPAGYTLADLSSCLPKFAVDSLRSALPKFAKKIEAFDAYDGVITGVETRSSSPVRILRDDERQSSVRGIYPCGEGAGYSGGITSSAVDGIRTALAILECKSQSQPSLQVG